MITAAVLALGATLIYQSFFIAVNSLSYYSTLLKTTPWMDEKIWQAQNDLKHSGTKVAIPVWGQLEINNKSMNWGLTYNALDQTDNLYQVDLELSWSQGSRKVKLSRSTYALHLEK